MFQLRDWWPVLLGATVLVLLLVNNALATPPQGRVVSEEERRIQELEGEVADLRQRQKHMDRNQRPWGGTIPRSTKEDV